MRTDAYDRSDLISLLFRETDRAQRMKTPLSLVAFCVFAMELDCRHRTAPSDDAIRQVAERTRQLVRTYDDLGRIGFDRFLLVLPGCDTFDAMALTERLRIDLFSNPPFIAQQRVLLSACFGIASSNGRSPIVAIREVECALKSAIEKGPGSIIVSTPVIPSPHDPALRSQ